LTGASISATSAFVPSQGGPDTHPFWFYVGCWIVFGAVPAGIAFWLVRRWARETRPDEWALVSAGRLETNQLSRPMKIATLLIGLSAVIPLVVASTFLFGPIS
jgi:hypothetical protein